MHRQSQFTTAESNQKPQSRPSASLAARGRRSFRQTVFLDTPIPTSILDHITNAEDIYETNLFSTGSLLRVLRANLDWETKILKSFGQKPLEKIDRATSLSIPEFLSSWASALKQGNDIARQFPI
jgi:hypothetical protein